MTLKSSIFLVIVILLVDQASKIYIKTNFQLQESVALFSWFQLLFVENDGMAWGAKISDLFTFMSDRTAKVILTLFRIVAVSGIAYWLVTAINKKATKILIVAICFILAGALGNIIDSVFYGVLFNDSYGQVASFLPVDGGYDKFLHGKVVDMLHFPLWKGRFPDWLPFWGGDAFTFFQPVFNVADIAISTGVGALLIFNNKAFKKPENNEAKNDESLEG